MRKTPYLFNYSIDCCAGGETRGTRIEALRKIGLRPAPVKVIFHTSESAYVTDF